MISPYSITNIGHLINTYTLSILQTKSTLTDAFYVILLLRTRRELGSSPKGGDTMRDFDLIQLIIAFLTLVVAVLQLLK